MAPLSSLALALASCGSAASGGEDRGERGQGPAADGDATNTPFAVETKASFDEPWAMDFDASTNTAIITEKAGTIRLYLPNGTKGTVSGAPRVAYAGQGGLGDVRFAPQPGWEPRADGSLDGRRVYLSWAEPSAGETSGAAVGLGTLACTAPDACALTGLRVIWRQQPKVTGHGHYSHRLAFSPDDKYLFVSSGERQKQSPAQDLSNTLGTIVRLLPDGRPAPGNPFAAKGSPSDEIWSFGHRNVLGLAFDADGNLWDLEHGPQGGDEINLIRPGQNYGWPLVSDGDHYDGTPIPRSSSRPDLAQPAISWNPVIAPGDFILYKGDKYPGFHGKAVVASFAVPGLVLVSLNGSSGVEEARYPLANRIREIREDPGGTIWLLEDGPAPDSGHLLKLVPRKASSHAN
ncbi:PQQ-dependent sugar dehydrogenase [Novosphingobium sp. 1949]|uniref:PQQ-dependent sugar dehydrogenase n=1 Tax=Novosphingobium organovorum TaxID=2930092 RepID=A0ABT0B848_9SPHN|nr:PQQ-dependent sugar dehydrogenase [Novosphingobium organovorum]MCJ2181219.1 PQQ-dependent sugar dehydrogenase [Novosphingobium organovorum]